MSHINSDQSLCLRAGNSSVNSHGPSLLKQPVFSNLVMMAKGLIQERENQSGQCRRHCQRTFKTNEIKKISAKLNTK